MVGNVNVKIEQLKVNLKGSEMTKYINSSNKQFYLELVTIDGDLYRIEKIKHLGKVKK